jgi:hypothetical protein
MSHLSDAVLERDLRSSASEERVSTARLIAHIAEFDARRLYLQAGYPSMHAWCMGELGMWEQAAYKRIHVARKARQFPAILAAIEDGRLHLSAATLLAAHLNHQNCEELVGEAAHKSKSEIELLLAKRFPRSEVLPMVEILPAVAEEPVKLVASGQVEPVSRVQLSPGKARCSVPSPSQVEVPRTKVAPIAPQRFVLHLTMSLGTRDKLKYAQDLLGRDPQRRHRRGVRPRSMR